MIIDELTKTNTTSLTVQPCDIKPIEKQVEEIKKEILEKNIPMKEYFQFENLKERKISFDIRPGYGNGLDYTLLFILDSKNHLTPNITANNIITGYDIIRENQVSI
ncbi:MAG: hypothetical protein Tsb0021_02400 [Chlamydiales bacterium]